MTAPNAASASHPAAHRPAVRQRWRARRWAAVAVLVVVLVPALAASVIGPEATIGKADRVIQEAADRVPFFPRARLEESVAPGEEVVREFTWVYHGVPYAWRVGLDAEAYARTQERPRTLDPRAYGIYVTSPEDDPAVARIAAALDAVADARGYSDVERANLALAFVQGLEYALDWDERAADDYPKFPIETLVDGGGDCEDTSALYASIARAMGLDVTLLLLDGHMAAGVRIDGVPGPRFGGYAYAETTRAGFRVGEVPWTFRGEDARPLPVEHVPALALEWTVRPDEWGFLVRVDVWNNGTAPANFATVYAGADATGAGDWRGSAETLGTLQPGAHAVRWIWVDLPPSEAHALRAVAWADDVPAVGDDRPNPAMRTS